MASHTSQQQPEQQTSISAEDVQLMRQMMQQYEQQMSAMAQEKQQLLAALQQQRQQQQQQQQQQHMAVVSNSSSSSPPPQGAAAPFALARIDLKPLQPSAFSGQGNHAMQWLAEVERYFAVAGLPESDPRRVALASTYLKDIASGWYMAMASEWGPQPLWPEFKARFEERFRPIAASRVARAALRDLKHHHKVEGYTRIFQSHMQFIHDMSVTDQIETYLNGLQQHIAAEVDRDQPKTLAEAMQIAHRIESLLATRRGKSAFGPPRRAFVPYRNGGGGGGGDRSDPMEVSVASHDGDSVSHEHDGGEEHVNAMSFRGRGGRGGRGGGRGGRGGARFGQKLEPAELQKLYDEGRCFNCKEQGHSARFCTKQSKN
jgi:hypothetical protein